LVVVIDHDSAIEPVQALMKTFRDKDVEPMGFVYSYDGFEGEAARQASPGDTASLRS
jgi:hypothetical protein